MRTTVWHENGSHAALVDFELRQAARSMLVARQAMRNTLPADLIHDVALELLLRLYLAHPSAIPMDELLADLSLPATSAMRWVAAITSEALARPLGGCMAMTDAGLARMTDMLTKVVRSQRRLHGWASN